MRCTNCGANLPPGAVSCPLCGLPTPYNATGAADSPQIAPTVIAPQSPYGAYGSPPPLDPTVAIPSPGGMPSTGYGTPPPPPGPNPYDPNAVNPYNAPTSPFEAPPQYGVPPMQQGGYVAPPQVGPGGYGYGAPPPKRRSRVGLIVGIVLLVVLLACVGVSVLVYEGAKQGIDSVTATVTAAVGTATSIPTTDTTTTTGQGTPPSGQSIDATAAGIISNIQTASAVDQTNATPTQPATTFTTQQTIYATVDLNMNGQTGYAEAKWYGDNTLLHTSKILNINDPNFAHAFFSVTYSIATQGAVEIYWCTQSDCSDAALAGVTNFTVTSSSFHWQGQPPVAFIDSNRPYVAGLQ